MPYSAEGYLTAQQLVMSFLLPQIEKARPGSVRSSLDAVAKHLSGQLEADPDQPTLKDALYIVGQWSEVLPAAQEPASASDPAAAHDSVAPSQSELDEHNLDPNLLTGIARGYLAYFLAGFMLQELEAAGVGIQVRTLNSATMTFAQLLKDDPSPLYDEIARLCGILQVESDRVRKERIARE